MSAQAPRCRKSTPPLLSPQLSFAVVPVAMFTSDRRKLGELIAPRWVTALAVATAAVIIAFNIKLLHDQLLD